MGKKYECLNGDHVEFVRNQKLFFVGTAASEGRVNISPKGMDTLRIIGERRVVWLSVTGSGNETAAHLLKNPRMTLMFCSFEEKPLILRIYGKAKVFHESDSEWNELYTLFDPLPGSRQIFDLEVELVQTSCGMAVPFYSYEGERDALKSWAIRKGREGIEKYWEEKNAESIDGFPTGIAGKP
jgi:hypothetical protein